MVISSGPLSSAFSEAHTKIVQVHEIFKVLDSVLNNILEGRC